MYSKIVDCVAVTSKARPLSGGKCERWWREAKDKFYHSLGKQSKRRDLANTENVMTHVYDTLNAYKLKGFEFGNWLNQADRYDSMCAFERCAEDLSNLLKSTNIGFDNQIGIAFGARGSGKALAHYEPGRNIINMTKEKGAGSLMHEYAHALDYSIGAFIDQNATYTALSGGRSLTQWSGNVGGQFRYMMNKILIYVRQTESYKKLQRNNTAPEYWENSTELFARLSEAYYAYFYNTNSNHYLVKPVSYYMADKHGFYLTRAEILKIKPDLDAFYKEVGRLLNNNVKIKAMPFPTIQKKALKLYHISRYYKSDWAHRDKKRSDLRSEYERMANGGTEYTKTEAMSALRKIVKDLKSDPNVTVYTAILKEKSLLVHYDRKNAYQTWNEKYYYEIDEVGAKSEDYDKKKERIFGYFEKLKRNSKGLSVTKKPTHKAKKSSLKKKAAAKKSK